MNDIRFCLIQPLSPFCNLQHDGNELQGQWKLAAGTDSEVAMGWIKRHVQTFSDGFKGIGIGGGDYFVLPRSAWAGTWTHSAGEWRLRRGKIASKDPAVNHGVTLSFCPSRLLFCDVTAALWSGDINSDFNTFAIQIKVLQQVMMRCVPYLPTQLELGFFLSHAAIHVRIS